MSPPFMIAYSGFLPVRDGSCDTVPRDTMCNHTTGGLKHEMPAVEYAQQRSRKRKFETPSQNMFGNHTSPIENSDYRWRSSASPASALTPGPTCEQYSRVGHDYQRIANRDSAPCSSDWTIWPQFPYRPLRYVQQGSQMPASRGGWVEDWPQRRLRTCYVNSHSRGSRPFDFFRRSDSSRPLTTKYFTDANPLNLIRDDRRSSSEQRARPGSDTFFQETSSPGSQSTNWSFGDREDRCLEYRSQSIHEMVISWAKSLNLDGVEAVELTMHLWRRISVSKHADTKRQEQFWWRDRRLTSLAACFWISVKLLHSRSCRLTYKKLQLTVGHPLYGLSKTESTIMSQLDWRPLKGFAFGPNRRPGLTTLS